MLEYKDSAYSPVNGYYEEKCGICKLFPISQNHWHHKLTSLAPFAEVKG